MKKIVIDGNQINNLEDFYVEIENNLTRDLNWKIGNNFDAFTDLLRGGFGIHEYGKKIKIIWQNHKKSKEKLSWEETIKFIENKIEKCHPSNKEEVKQDLEFAKMGKGDTLFELIIKIINENKNVSLKLE